MTLDTTTSDRVLRPMSVPIDTEELNDLRRTSAELREVVRYMKRERDLLEAKQSVTEGEVCVILIQSYTYSYINSAICILLLLLLYLYLYLCSYLTSAISLCPSPM